jgi:type II secretory pathway pseudopilin PulG
MARAMLKTIVWCARNTGGKNLNPSIMVVHYKQADKRIAANAFSLIEVCIACVILALAMSGLMYGYVQANRMAEWSSMSLAAQSYASQGAEQLRAADWRPRDPSTVHGANTGWEIWPIPYTNQTTGILDIPIKGNPASTNFAFFVTNIVTVTEPSTNPPLLQIRSDAYWIFPLTGQQYKNTVILQRAPDQ